jgi:hypothetical protein
MTTIQPVIFPNSMCAPARTSVYRRREFLDEIEGILASAGHKIGNGDSEGHCGQDGVDFGYHGQTDDEQEAAYGEFKDFIVGPDELEQENEYDAGEASQQYGPDDFSKEHKHGGKDGAVAGSHESLGAGGGAAVEQQCQGIVEGHDGQDRGGERSSGLEFPEDVDGGGGRCSRRNSAKDKAYGYRAVPAAGDEPGDYRDGQSD